MWQVTAWGEKQLLLRPVLCREAPGPGGDEAGTGQGQVGLLTRPERSLSRARKPGVRPLLTRGRSFYGDQGNRKLGLRGGGGTGNTEAWAPGRRACHETANQPV